MPITTTTPPRAALLGFPVQDGWQPDPFVLASILDEILTLAASAADLALVASGLAWQGVWDADADSPTIPAAAGGNDGHFYWVGTAGTTEVDGVSDWAVGDYVVSDGSAWHRINVGVGVVTIAGKTGSVILESADISDSTTLGRALLSAENAAAARTLLSAVDATAAFEATASGLASVDAKTSVVAGDWLSLVDSEDSNALKRLSFSNLRSYLRTTSFDSVYASAAQGSTADSALQPADVAPAARATAQPAVSYGSLALFESAIAGGLTAPDGTIAFVQRSGSTVALLKASSGAEAVADEAPAGWTQLMLLGA